MPRIRVELEDFRVEEVSLFAPIGEGGHTFLWVEKRDTDTDRVARALARMAGVPARDVGYAGRKDRRAVARQWFSVPGLDPEQALALALPRARVLRALRHPHKLRTGALRANRFEIVVRGVGAATATRVEHRLAELARAGMPNRFGRQRFGETGDNLARARALLAGELVLRDRRAARFLVSVLQAAVFNQVLAARPLPLDVLESGDVALVHASGGLFRVEDGAVESLRAARFEISPTGPIFGTRIRGRSPAPNGSPAVRERAALDTLGIGDPARLTLPRGVRLRGARRALRVRPEALDFSWAEDVLRLRFQLPSGSYATVLLEELFEGAGLQEG